LYSNTIDTIYHCGAIVNHVFPYQDLKHVNVDSTKEILALACSGKQLKRIHYMSTASVFSPKYHRGRDLTEHTPLMLQELPDLGGYAQSKWVSERLCKEAFDRGVPVTIYRIGMASWSTKTGFSNYRDWFDRLLFGMLCLPGAPVSSAVLNLIPVNFVAEIIVKLANTVSASKDFEIFHLSHSSPVPFTELVKGLIALNVDEQCQDISEEVRDEIKSHQKALAKNQTHKEWVKSLIAAIQEASETGNAPRANVLSSLLLFDSGIPDDSRWRFSVEHTKKRLDSHLWCPTIEPKDIGTLAIQLAKRLQGSL
jgi:thioester reductase-like protein